MPNTRAAPWLHVDFSCLIGAVAFEYDPEGCKGPLGANARALRAASICKSLATSWCLRRPPHTSSCNALQRPPSRREASSRPRWPRVERFRQLGKRLGVAQARVSEEVPCAVSSFEGPSRRGVGWRWRRLRDSGGIQHHSRLLRCSVYAQRPGERGSDTEGGQDEICAGV